MSFQAASGTLTRSPCSVTLTQLPMARLYAITYTCEILPIPKPTGARLNIFGSATHPNSLMLASERGYSVFQVIESVRQVTGKPVRISIKPRRPGDPARLIADPNKAQRILSWSPRHSDLPTIVRTAWSWHLRHPRGYVPIAADL